MLLARFGVSERRACRTVGIHRSTQRLAPPPVTAEEAELRAWLRKFSTDRPRWGWRRAAKMARRAGWKVNNKRIRRLWRDEGPPGAATAPQEAPHRDRRPGRRDVTDPTERDLGAWTSSSTPPPTAAP